MGKKFHKRIKQINRNIKDIFKGKNGGRGMIKEAYCSYEVSRLLKEKGFNVPTEMVWYEHIPSHNVAHKREAGSKKLDYFYWDENTERNSFYTNDTNENGMPVYITGKVYSAPTHQMAMAWLRKKGYHIYTVYDTTHKYWHRHIQASTGVVWSLGGLASHDEAVETALKYALECLI